MIFIVFLVLFCQQGNASPVTGGKDVGEVMHYFNKVAVVNPGTFGYLVYLTITIPDTVEQETSYTVFHCSGVIIRPNVVLTAAHCIGANVKHAKIVAWAGIVDIQKEKSKGQKIEVKKYKVHEKFGLRNDPNYSSNDIALLWLKAPFITNSLVKIAKLPEKQFDPNGKLGSVVGWGRTACGASPSMLQRATTKGMRKYECQLYYVNLNISNNVICALSDDRKSAGNFGDSGGPFVVDGKVVGINSFGQFMYVIGRDNHDVEVCNPKKPVVYTDVSKYLRWINEQLKEKRISPLPALPPKRGSSLKYLGKLKNKPN